MSDLSEIPYGATHEVVIRGLKYYAWISADWFVFKWSEAEQQWYFHSKGNIYHMFDTIEELDEPTMVWDE